MAHQEFQDWFEELKKSANEDFGYSEIEVSNFNAKSWNAFYEQGFTPFESVMQHLKKTFQHQNG